LLNQKSAIDESLFIDNIFQTQKEKFTKEKESLLKEIEKYHTTDFVDHVEGFVENFFDEWTKNDIDFDYLLKVVPMVFKLESELKEQVNTYTQTFTYDDMDIMDRALFLL
jgi:transcription termination factor NusB